MANYTRDPPKEVQLPPRLPLVGVPNQRAASANIDSRLINGYIEVGADEHVKVVKRPGLTVLYELPVRTALGAWGRYSIYFSSAPGPAVDTYLYQDNVLKASFRADDGTPYSSDIVSKPYNFGDTTQFFHNSSYAFTYDAVDGFKQVPLTGTAAGSLTGTLAIGSPVVTGINTTTLTRFSTVTGTGIPADTLIESIDSPTQLTLTQNATAAGAQLLTFAHAGPGSAALLYGVGDLNTAVYLYNVRREIHGSELVSPLEWNPLNTIVAYRTQSQPIALFTHLSYLVAFKAEETEFFRDAGNSPGSPLERVDGLAMDVGAYYGPTIAKLNDSIFWVSSSESGLRSVWQLRAGKSQEIAWPSIKRIISANASGFDPTYAIAFTCSGHPFYVLTSPTGGYSLVYDQASNFWSYWSALGETYFPFVAATQVGSETRLQHESNGKIYVLDPDAFVDEGDVFDLDIYPPEYDANLRVSKYLSKLYVVGDQTADSTLHVRVNDENQASGEWSNFREIDLSVARPRLDECGSFYKRSFHFRHSSPTRCRIEAIELELYPGTL